MRYPKREEIVATSAEAVEVRKLDELIKELRQQIARLKSENDELKQQLCAALQDTG